MTRSRSFFSILCVLLAAVAGLLLSPIHPGWAVRLTRYVSHSLLGGRRGKKRGKPHTPVDRKIVRASTARKPPVRRAGRGGDRGSEPRHLQAVPAHPEPGNDGSAAEVQSALVNLGMRRSEARKLAKQSVQGRDFDAALLWAIGRAA